MEACRRWCSDILKERRRRLETHLAGGAGCGFAAGDALSERPGKPFLNPGARARPSGDIDLWARPVARPAAAARPRPRRACISSTHVGASEAATVQVFRRADSVAGLTSCATV